MKASEYFNVLPSKLVCFDTDTNDDQTVYIDPSKLIATKNKYFNSKIADKKIKDFFDTIFALEAEGNYTALNAIILPVKEVKETHIGEARSGFDGHGPNMKALRNSLKGMNSIKDALTKKTFYSTLTYFVMTSVYAERFKEDGLSDLITNIVYQELIDFTNKVFSLYGKKNLSPKTENHEYWDVITHSWVNKRFEIFEIDSTSTILLPVNTLVPRYSTNAIGFLKSGYCKLIKEKQNGTVTQKVLFENIKQNKNGKPYTDIAIQKTIEEPNSLQKYIDTKF